MNQEKDKKVEVYKSYGKAFVLSLSAVLMALIFAFCFVNSFGSLSETTNLIIEIIANVFFGTGVIGLLGLKILTWGQDSPQEKLDDFLYKAVFLVGLFLYFIPKFISFFI
ncbi:MAG: hypothetical protein V4439_04420 [Patescibacteria group bacterium]